VSTAVLSRGGPLALVGSTDHKRIALRVGAVAFLFFLAGGVLALVMRAELAQPGLQVVSRSTYNALFTMHGSTMIYLFVIPVGLALGLYLVPLQVGAAELAGSRWALAGSSLVILGGLTMWTGFLVQGGAAQVTWVGFDPLSDSVNSPGKATDLWIFGVALATAGELAMGATILATLLRRRAPAMTMLRMPVFCWAMLVTCLMVVFALPVLIAAMALLWVDRQWGGVFDGPDGPVVYQHLFWFYGHPVVYVMFFPFLGAVAEVIAVFSGKRFFAYRGMVLGLLVFASLSMSVWAHHMFTIEGVAVKYFSLTSTLLVIPAGTEYFALIATMRGGSLRMTTAMLFALAFLVQFLIGGLSGIWVASAPLDYHANNSYVVVAHFHYTLLAGSIFGFFAAVFYWWPKVTGVFLREGLGKLQVALFAVGTNLTFLPQFVLGQEGMTRRIADYPGDLGWDGWNLASSLGAGLIGLSVLVFCVNAAFSLLVRRPAGDDPWEGHTLEWATSSPPPRHNFARLPPIRSFAPLQDLREAARPR
jgi:cytochrome c oxidase subunit 1